MTLTADFRSTYGVVETNPLDGGADYHAAVHAARPVTLREVAEHGGRVTRVRLLTDSWAGTRMADVSYIHVTFPNGVSAPLIVSGSVGGPLWGKQGIKAQFIAWARQEGVNAKALGLLDEAVWSILY